MRLWTKKIDDGVHVESRTVGQCIAMRYRAREADPKLVRTHDAAVPETVRRKNDLINNEFGVDSPLLPDAIATFKTLFRDSLVIPARRAGRHAYFFRPMAAWLATTDQIYPTPVDSIESP